MPQQPAAAPNFESGEPTDGYTILDPDRSAERSQLHGPIHHGHHAVFSSLGLLPT